MTPLRPSTSLRALSIAGLAALATVVGCGGNDPLPEDTRPQDSKTFAIDDTQNKVFISDAGQLVNPPVGVDTDRWTGTLDGAPYRIEVPKTGWNGKLVMWTHGYRGPDGTKLTVDNPIIRRYLLTNGYAWAASGYSKNNYDVRAGIEDTNNLALNFVKIAGTNGRSLAAPSKMYITGVSMGGHIAAAAVEAETINTANHVVKYAGSVPMCGVVGDNELFNYFAGYQLAAQQLAGVPMTAFPQADFASLAPAIKAALWSTYPTQTNAQGDKLKTAVSYLSGGPRPFFAEGWANASNQGNIWNSIGSDGTISGILNLNVLNSAGLSYTIDTTSAAADALNKAFNASIYKIQPAADANRLRRDGLRWIPQVNGDISVPVVTLHTLGDLFVPFKMEQVYAARTKAKGTDKWLVQRAIRDVGHCAFTAAEATAAFDAMVAWEGGGAKPAGDDVTTAATLADPKYGCTYTVNTPSYEDYTAPASRAGYQANYPACN